VRLYLLDAGPLAALLLDRPAAVALCTPWLANREAATSILVYGEVFEYIQGMPNFERHRTGLRELLRGVPPHFLTYRILEGYADLRRRMRPPHGGGLIGDVDTLIAATALARGLTVVTTDHHFARVPGLNVRLIERASLLARQR
jgi:predicted nucleic acid-binding protein